MGSGEWGVGTRRRRIPASLYLHFHFSTSTCPHSPLPTPHFPLPIPHSPFPIPHSPFRIRVESMKIDHNTVAVVTGAASGIGHALAVRLAQEGASLAIADIRVAELNEAARGLK